MDFKAQLYAFFRAARWISWLSYLIYCIYFLSNRQPHLDQFGHLILTTELALYAIPVIAIFIGFFEMMTRERAGFAKPVLGQWMPRKGEAPKAAQFIER